MYRLVGLFIVLCVSIAQAEAQLTPPELQNRYVTTHIPVYRGAEPFTARFQKATRRGVMTVIIDVAKTIAEYPESMRPWKPGDLKGVKIFLPLGDGESIDDKL